MFGLLSIKNWLQSTWKLTVPEDWLTACVNWINTEHEQNRLPFEQVCNMVLDQWLMCDLKDIGAHSLPLNISNSPKYILQGVFVFQINFMVDVSSSLYSQVQKAKGSFNENSLVNFLTQQSQYNSTQHQHNKPSRMLLLHLHDGKQEVKAIEYSHISSLNQSLLIGTKMLVHGKVLCRRGVLFLKQENVTVIGGGIDEEEEGKREYHTSEDAGNNKYKLFENFLNNNISNQTAFELPKKTFPTATTLFFHHQADHNTSAYSRNYRNNNNNNNEIIHDNNVIPNAAAKILDTELNLLEDDVDDEEMMMMMMSTGDDENHHQKKKMKLNEKISSISKHNAITQKNQYSIERRNMQSLQKIINQNINNKMQQCSKAFIVPYRSNRMETLKSLLLKLQSGAYTVEARVKHVLGNLASNGGIYWSLKVQLVDVVDNTHVLVVDMHDELISTLIGFTACRVKDLKKDDKANLQIRDKIEKFMLRLFEFSTFELEVTRKSSHNSDSYNITTNDPNTDTISQFSICLKDAR